MESPTEYVLGDSIGESINEIDILLTDVSVKKLLVKLTNEFSNKYWSIHF
jgi:hypothetical protein